MKPIHLLLKNFTGIKAGLGRDEIEIDFSRLTKQAGLTALIGVNGAGKSTLLDNTHPYRIMPSRAGGLTPGSFSFFDHIYGAEAEKMLEWSHQGKHYRSSLIFKQSGKTKKQEAYLHIRQNQSWSPAWTTDGDVVSDGKTSTYDQVLNSILGTPDMFFTSVFAAQNKRHLSSYNNGEIKTLLSELLGLDAVRDLGDKARAVTKQLMAHLENMREDIERVSHAEHEQHVKRTEHSQLTENLKTQLVLRQKARQSVAHATRELADLQAMNHHNTDLEIRRQTLADRLLNLDARTKKQLAEIDEDIRAESIDWEDTRNFYAYESGNDRKTLEELQLNIRQYEKLLSQKADIEAAQKETEALNAELQEARRSAGHNGENAATYRQLKQEFQQLDARLETLTKEENALTHQIQDLEKRGRLMEEVPCAKTEYPGQCPLLKETRHAQATLPGIIAAREANQKAQQEVRQQQQAMSPVIESLTGIEATLKASENKVNALHERVMENNQLIALAPTLTQTESTLRTARKQVSQIETRLQDRDRQRKQAEEKSKAQIAGLEARKITIKDHADNEMSSIHRELSVLPVPMDHLAIETAEAELAKADQALSDIEQQVESTQAGIAALKAELEALAKQLNDADQVKAMAEHIEHEITHWRLLGKALGNDGIVALSIDDAGPTLAALTNELLLACFGPRFTVRLDTQSETARGDLRESFEITVFDAEHDAKKPVNALSGGERIWINEAMTRAIALYQSQQSGQHYHYLFADETDGPLDPDRKQQFMDMKRKVLELGNYEGEIFISHTPELWAMADSTIDMNRFRS